MARFALAVASTIALALPAIPVIAQDYTGNTNPGAWTSSMPMEASIRAQARRNGGSNRNAHLPPRTREVCGDLPNIRARHGADDSRVRKLTVLCREVGYR